MKFSLKWLLGLIVLICVVLGAREARRSYLWHRELPVTYYHQPGPFEHRMKTLGVDMVGFPAKGEVIFDSRLIQRVEDAARVRRQDRIDQTFQRYQDHAKWQASKVISLLPPKLKLLESLSLEDQQDLMARFERLFAGKRLPEAEQVRLVQAWLCFPDPAAVDQAIRLVRSKDEGATLEMLSALQELAEAGCSPWLASSKQLEEAVVAALPKHFQAAARLVETCGFVSAVPMLKQRLDGNSPKMHASNFGEREFRQFEEKLNVLDCLCAFHADEELMSVLESMASQLKLKGAKVAETGSNRSEVLLESVRLALLRQKFQRSLRNFCENANGEVKRKAASLAFQLNDLQAYLKAFSGDDEEILRRLFEHRNSLAAMRNLAGHYAIGDGPVYGGLDVEEVFEQKFQARAPNPLSGFESSYLMTDLIELLAEVDPEFARDCIFELIQEGAPMAVEVCPEFLNAERDIEAIKFLQRQLQTTLNLENRLVSSYSQRHFASSQMIYRALFKILPDQRPISPFEQLHASLERMERIPALDQLAQLLTGNGLVVEPTEPLLNEKQRKKNPAELAWALTRNAHLASGKAVPLGLNQVSRIPESLDRILTLVKEDVRLDADSSWETIRIASPDRVYQFQIQQGGSEGMFKDEQLSDLVNHILQRQGVRNRLVCVSGPDSNDYVFYGSPKLFRKLHEEFGVNFQEGSEQYVEAANGQANLLAK